MEGVDDKPAAAAGSINLGARRRVNRMGFGAMRLTGKGIWGEPRNAAAARAVLHRALELGINFIDTADSYGPEVSEQLIAEAIYPYPEELVIATKGGLVRPGPGDWRRDARPERLTQCIDDSLRRLRIETIDLYQLHAPDPQVPIEESVGALWEALRAGKIRQVGVSNVSVEELERARDVAPIASVQNRYSLADRSSDDVLEVCAGQGIAFIPFFPLEAGALAEPGGALEDVAKAHDATPAQIALAWLLHRSPAMLPIPGTSRLAHLEENTAAAAIELSESELRSLGG